MPTGGNVQAVLPREVRAGAMGDSWIADARYALRAEIAAVGGTDYSAGVCFRHVDGGNTFPIQRTSSGSTRYWRIMRRIANAATVLHVSSVSPADGDRFEVHLNGPDIEVFINNVSVRAGTDTAHQTATKHGVAQVADVAAEYDNVSFKSAWL